MSKYLQHAIDVTLEIKVTLLGRQQRLVRTEHNTLLHGKILLDLPLHTRVPMVLNGIVGSAYNYHKYMYQTNMIGKK